MSKIKCQIDEIELDGDYRSTQMEFNFSLSVLIGVHLWLVFQFFHENLP